MVLQMVALAVVRAESMRSSVLFVTRVTCDKTECQGKCHSSRMLARIT